MFQEQVNLNVALERRRTKYILWL